MTIQAVPTSVLDPFSDEALNDPWALYRELRDLGPERFWSQPDTFDSHRNNMRQLAFGYGVHSCIGQGLARLEGHSVLAALARRVECFEIGKSTPFRNNMVHGLETLPVTITRSPA